MKKSLFFKIWLGFLVLIIIFVILFDALVFRSVHDFYINNLSEHYRDIGAYLVKDLNPYVSVKNYSLLKEKLKLIAGDLKIRVTIVNTNGIVLEDSESETILMANISDRPEIADIISGKKNLSIRYSKATGNEMSYMALPFIENGKMIGILRLGVFLNKNERFIDSIKWKIIFIGLLILILSIVISALFSEWVTYPIQSLINMSNEIAIGNFKARLYLKQGGEFKILSDCFNMMTEKIEQLFETVNKQKEEFRALVDSVLEGILLLDEKDSIIQWNKGFEKIVSAADFQEKHYWEVIREASLISFVDRLKESEVPLSEEIKIGVEYYLASGAFLKKERRTIIIFHNITGLKNLEVTKRDLILNASHELRTPLTAIKGFLETISLEPTGKSIQKYLPIIQKHTDRLIAIVDDLLKLSDLERPEYKLNVTKIDIKNLMEASTKIFAKRIEDKGLSFRVDLFEAPKTIEGDEFLLQEMLINLIDNAVKYTDQGEIRIVVQKSDDRVIFRIIDTGIGIPEESLTRIFERFYVVDKSRSRRSGGTGLGLSIVKHIVLLHSGTINVNSSSGSGTVFTISLPIKLTKN